MMRLPNPKSKLTGAAWPGNFGISRLAQPLGGDQGATLVESALVLLLLLIILFGIMDFSRFMYAYHFVSEVAREATRYAAVRGSTWGNTSCVSTSTFACNATAANVTSFVQGLTPPGLNSSWTTSTSCPPSQVTQPTVSTCWPGTSPQNADTGCDTSNNNNNNPGCNVEVVVSYPFKFIFPFLPKSTLKVSSTSWMVISQ